MTAEAESNSLKQTIGSFFQEVPDILPSYKQGPPNFKSAVKFLYFSGPDAQALEKTVGFYPFQTLRDIKMKVSRLFSQGATRQVHPYQLAFLIPLPFEDETEAKQTKQYAIFDFIWTTTTAKGSTREVKVVNNPFLQATAGPNPDFVSSAGQKKSVGLSEHSRMLFEEALTLRRFTLTQIQTIHIFAVQDVIRAIPSPRPLSEPEWIGKVHPYFPLLLPEQNGGVTTAQLEEVEAYTNYELLSENLLAEYDTILAKYTSEYKKKEHDPYRLRIGGVKYLRLKWNAPAEGGKQPDTLFYELPVTEVRPFMRILPSDGDPVTKLLIKPGTIHKIPRISDPKLLKVWASEKSPTPDKDFLMVKTVLREEQEGLVPAYYGTLRVYADQMADYVVQAPSHLRRFDVRSDLAEFPLLLSLALKDTPYQTEEPTIAKTSILCGIRLPVGSPQIKRDEIRSRVQAMSYFFQEITPLPGSPPFISLRYKAVSNFISQDRINTFLKQLTDRFAQEGRSDADAIEYLMREFNLNRTEAISRYSQFRSKDTQILTIDPEAKEYIELYDYGIDISVFAQHPFYSFHIYGITSQIALQRIMTSLYLLFGTQSSDWTRAKQYVVGFNRIADLVQREEQEEQVPPVQQPATTTTTTTTTTLAEEKKEEEEEEETEGPAETRSPDLENLGANGANFNYTDMMFEPAYENGDVLDAAASENPEAKPLAEVLGTVNPKQELAGLLDEPARAQMIAKQPQAPVETTQQPVVKPRTTTEIERPEAPESFAQYFLDRLQQADRVLFDFPKATESSKQYPTMCQANDMRQPVVMSVEQFEVMLEKYGAARRRQFVRIGYDPATNEPFADQPPEEGDYVTCIFFGSDVNRSHYYLCPKYFCVNDYVVVFGADFTSTLDFNGNEKPANSCPFCHGKKIQNRTKPARGETVYERKVKPKSTPPKAHEWVAWLLDKEAHPKGFRIPCCFTQDYDIKATDEAFAHYRAKKKIGLPQEQRKAPTPAQGAIPSGQPFLDYKITLDKIEQRYILGPEKIPLAIGNQYGPQIGLLPKVLDAYFSQDSESTQLVSRDFTRMVLVPNARGFMRIAVENRLLYRKEGFFAALAPYINENTIEGVRQKLWDEISPKIFVNLNYGNLLLEFYDPDYPLDKDEAGNPIENDEWLDKWASDHLDVDYYANQVYVRRIYLSYKKFRSYLKDPSQPKEYRQFAHFLSAKLPITSGRGIIFMILNITEDGRMNVECPPFGYDPEKHDGCDIGILMHHWTGVWEPIFYVHKSATYDPEHPLPPPILKFQQADAAMYWPEILRIRVEEFRGRCESSGKSIYTSQRGISSDALITPLDLIEKINSQDTKYRFYGYVKDAYNHTVALTFGIPRIIQDVGGKQYSFERVKLVAVPVVDDGNITYFNKHLHLDWTDFDRAPADKVYTFYQKYIVPVFPEYQGYAIERKIEMRANNAVAALQLRNGILIPVSPPIEPTVLSALPTVQKVELEYEWEINKKIFFGNSQTMSREKKLKAEQNDLEEVYQHLRYMFGNWIADDRRADLRDLIEKTINKRDLRVFEKRQRLYILIGTEIQSWLTAKYAAPTETYSLPDLNTLLRVDCSLKVEAHCTGRCQWRTVPSADNPAGVGKCLLHTPKTASVGGKDVDILPFFSYRLIEELIRFPERRKQLMERMVSGLVTITDAITLGKTQYIVPENTPAWFDLLRLDWATSGLDRPKYFEELSRQAGEEEAETKEEPSQGPPPASAIGALTLPGPGK